MKRTFILTGLCAALMGCNAGEETAKIDGFIVDATMNTLTVRALTSEDTYTFDIQDADKAEAYGLLTGNVVEVEYAGEVGESPKAIKVTADRTYANAIGSWTMPDPIDPDGKMGVEIKVEGAASSINMATLVYSSWELAGTENQIILHAKSIGNGVESDFTQKATITEGEDGKLCMKIADTNVVYEKEK